MNKIDLLSKMISSVWGLDKIRGRTILSSMVHSLITSQRPEEDIFGDPLPVMQKLGDIALIPFYGVISIDVPNWLKEWGFNLTDANDIAEEIGNALQDANVKMIVFDMNSPGGLSLAGNKLFEVVEAANRIKPCFAYCDAGRDMASAAYDSVAACRALIANPHADGVGCIGSYLAYLDDTEFWAQMGLKWEIFKSGDFKGIGESVPLTEPQREFLQRQADYFGAIIRGNVKKYRTLIADEDLQGQWYAGTESARRGFVYDLAGSLQEAIAKFQRLA